VILFFWFFFFCLGYRVCESIYSGGDGYDCSECNKFAEKVPISVFFVPT
jgi:hypothetical protein